MKQGTLEFVRVICPLLGWKIDLKTGEAIGQCGRTAAYPVRVIGAAYPE